MTQKRNSTTREDAEALILMIAKTGGRACMGCALQLFSIERVREAYRLLRLERMIGYDIESCNFYMPQCKICIVLSQRHDIVGPRRSYLGDEGVMFGPVRNGEARWDAKARTWTKGDGAPSPSPSQWEGMPELSDFKSEILAGVILRQKYS